MYDMYPWDDKAADPGQAPRKHRGSRVPAPRDGRDPVGTEQDPAELAAQALQFALDRRDNGGDTLRAAVGRPTAYQTRQ